MYSYILKYLNKWIIDLLQIHLSNSNTFNDLEFSLLRDNNIIYILLGGDG